MLVTKYQICLMANGDHNISEKHLVKICLWPGLSLKEGWQKIKRLMPLRSLDEIGS